MSRAAKAFSALEYEPLWGRDPGVNVAGVVLVGHAVLVGDHRPRAKKQP